MKTLNHPNILKVLGLKHNIPIKGTSNPTSDCRRDVLMMEYANAGSLLSVIKLGLDMRMKKCILIQIVEAFTHLH
jgi:serine/threonine protein kinase